MKFLPSQAAEPNGDQSAAIAALTEQMSEVLVVEGRQSLSIVDGFGDDEHGS